MDGYYNRKGEEITLAEWGRLFDDWNYKKVVKTTFRAAQEDVDISTVWLGLNHNLEGQPLAIFETMVFGGLLDQTCRRYATEHDAIVGHYEVCVMVAGDLPSDDEVEAVVKSAQLMADDLNSKITEIIED